MRKHVDLIYHEILRRFIIKFEGFKEGHNGRQSLILKVHDGLKPVQRGGIFVSTIIKLINHKLDKGVFVIVMVIHHSDDAIYDAWSA